MINYNVNYQNDKFSLPSDGIITLKLIYARLTFRVSLSMKMTYNFNSIFQKYVIVGLCETWGEKKEDFIQFLNG